MVIETKRIKRVLNDAAGQITARCADEKRALQVYEDIIDLMGEIDGQKAPSKIAIVFYWLFLTGAYLMGVNALFAWYIVAKGMDGTISVTPIPDTFVALGCFIIARIIRFVSTQE